jgi:Cu/Ag efflux pump CusA
MLCGLLRLAAVNERWQPGGILSSTALTLLVLPGLNRMFHRKGDGPETAEAATPPM